MYYYNNPAIAAIINHHLRLFVHVVIIIVSSVDIFIAQNFLEYITLLLRLLHLEHLLDYTVLQ